MHIEQSVELKTARHYDEAYYQGQYGSLIEDDLNYRLLSNYWRNVPFLRNGLDPDAKVLDFGSGIGQVSASLPGSVCFDVSSAAVRELLKRDRVVIENRRDIPKNAFDYVLSSHSLEHSSSPYQDLEEFRQYVRPAGKLILVLPIETHLRPTLYPDWNQHFQAWTFQTITNILISTGWTPLNQATVYGPYMLRTLGRRFSVETTIRIARFLGLFRRCGASMLTIARLA